MSKINANGEEPAFPTDSEHQTSMNTWHFQGLTKREWYAGMAMQGMIANSSDVVMQVLIEDGEKNKETNLHQTFTRNAFEIAKLMIKQGEIKQ